MAAYKSTIDKVRKEFTQRYLALDNLLMGTELSPKEAVRYAGSKGQTLLRHDAMAIRLAINDFKGILAEVAKIK